MVITYFKPKKRVKIILNNNKYLVGIKEAKKAIKKV